jgi:orotate phosphoribosyltransferase
MTNSDLDDLARDLDNCCRLSGKFLLRSGQVADEYFDKYLFESDPHLLGRIVDRMVPLIPPNTEILGGLELGGVPLSTMLSSRTGLPTLFIRKRAKEYGNRRLAEGCKPTGRVVVLVEDVITTGGAVREAAEALRALGATVTHVVCAVDRSIPGSEPLLQDGITINSVLTKALLDGARS